MKRIAVLAVLALACASALWAVGLSYSSGSSGISVTQTNTTVTFTDNHSGGASAAFAARHLLVRSRAASANTCYVDFNDGTATTADHALEPGAAISLNWDERDGMGGGWSQIGVICATGQTATFDVGAWR